MGLNRNAGIGEEELSWEMKERLERIVDYLDAGSEDLARMSRAIGETPSPSAMAIYNNLKQEIYNLFPEIKPED